MNQVPHITVDLLNEALNAAKPQAAGKYSIVDVFNAAQKLAEANAEQEQYITAEEARNLGVGNAEFFDPIDGNWFYCHKDEDYLPMGHTPRKYRAIKPEPTVSRSDFDFAMQDKQRCVRLIEEVYALLVDDKTVEAKELLQKSVNNTNVNIPPFIEPVEPTCQIKNLDSGATQTMTREKAKLLQAETRDTCDWTVPNGCMPSVLNLFTFETKGIYTYKRKANLVKLDGELMTREAAIAKYKAVKDKQDVWYGSENTIWITGFGENFALHSDGETIEYQLRAKPLKQVSWKDVPVGVMVNCFQLEGVFKLQWVKDTACQITQDGQAFYPAVSSLILAPASEQKWIAVQDLVGLKRGTLEKVGFKVEYKKDEYGFLAAYRITGLAEGRVLK